MTTPRFRILALAMTLAVVACAARAPRAALDAGTPEGALAAAEAALGRGDADDARRLLGGVPADALTPPQRARFQLAQAETALLEDQPVVALQALPPPGEVRETRTALRIEGARARALFRMGDAVGATQALVARERYLADPAQLTINRDELWHHLRESDLDTAGGARLAQADRAARGWIELAVISRSVWLNAHDLEARLAQWRADYPEHPGQDRIAGIAMPATATPARRSASHVALLLPLSGPHAASAETVRDGFFAAYYNMPAEGRPTVRVYDTGISADTLQAAYRAALDDGAEFLVGPLRREDVATLAEYGRTPVPLLALNYLDPGREAPFNFFQWGLAPEDEARQAAERAVAEHQSRAVALVPEGEWGERVLAAFRQRLEALGGTVVAAQTYVTSNRDHSEQIRALLLLDASEQRHVSLRSALGVKLEFQPRRRDDIDLVFLAARPEQARLLGPQLRFHRTGELPIYTTSLVYDGERPSADLNGLRFCDMPWMLATDGPWAALRQQLQTLFPNRPRDYARLLALGHDANTLVQLIDRGQLQPGSFYPAASGMLSLGPDGVITRGLGCAEIRQGGVKPLDLPLPGRS